MHLLQVSGRAEYAPYLLIMNLRSHPEIRAGAAGSAAEILDITLDALGHGNEAYTTFPLGDTAIQRIGTQFRISADLNGKVELYRRTESPAPSEEQLPLSENQLIERARLLIVDTIGGTCGNAEVFFHSLEYGAGGAVSVYFSYYIAGGSIFLFDNGYAARVTLVSGVVTEAELIYRNYSFTGEYSDLLPEMQSLAAAGGEFLLYYSDTGAEILNPFWG